ncbi:MAG TPA: UDP-N-acetylglucosamine--N-acetylmuramyl-(pentapeptide) pyrophosphoryl-undecaprenol N-acetylglucosamine transferase [Candidatus Babeliales bacterium]|nr:UDP-N-acetylglucosamine--N-acetylmuramyl-(pentapeptide) pyrophosphoryl-undecaprenol N-acetylglucosamine transferase [Candidatus Babeliales bacterium]
MKLKTVCYVAGKSGGHIIPCLTIADNSVAYNASINILFFSANTALDKKIIANNKHITWHVMLPLHSRTGSLFKIGWYTIHSFIVSFFYLCKHRPEQIITTGGIVAIPACIAAYILRIPITLHSLDAVPGKAIQVLIPLATSIITPFACSQHYFPVQKCSVKPYPLKYLLTQVINDKNLAQKQLGLSSNKKTVLILGGSQGSRFLNECMKNWISDASFSLKDFQIIHQTGSIDTTDWNALYKSKNITANVFSYRPDLALMYTAADLIICRAGAGTLFEIKFFNKQCIIIPLTTDSTTHQVDNARAMSSEYPDLFYTVMQKDIEEKPTLLHELIAKKITF